MEPMTILVIAGGAALLIVGLVLYVLNRSWGDSLPTQIEIPPSDYYTRQHQQPESDESDSLFVDDIDEATQDDEPDEFPDIPDAEQYHGDIPDSGLILIDHPLLLEVIERSLAEGGLATQYVVQEDDDLYVSLDLIKDPVQRRQAAEMIQKFQTQSQVGVWDMVSLATVFGRTRR
jgi:hypothetical protein